VVWEEVHLLTKGCGFNWTVTNSTQCVLAYINTGVWFLFSRTIIVPLQSSAVHGQVFRVIKHAGVLQRLADKVWLLTNGMTADA